MKKDELHIVYNNCYQSLFIYAFSLTKNKHDAEDLVASAFVKAFLSYQQGNIKAWLYKVLKNEFLNMIKKRKKLLDEGKINISYLEDPKPIFELLVLKEQKRWLYTKIYALKRKEREVMLLSLQAELSDLEIAEITNLEVNNIRVIKHRVKQQLIASYRKEENYGRRV